MGEVPDVPHARRHRGHDGRDEALWFTRIGTFLERADNTTRLLEARWRDPGGRGERLGPKPRNGRCCCARCRRSKPIGESRATA